MRLEDGRDVYALRSGRRFYAHGGVLGLAADAEPDAGLSEGWDGGVEIEDLTPAERREIAWTMIRAWWRWGFGRRRTAHGPER